MRGDINLLMDVLEDRERKFLPQMAQLSDPGARRFFEKDFYSKEFDATRQQILQYFAALKKEGEDPGALFGAPAAYYRGLMAWDLPTAVRESKLPTLVLQGGKDIQIRQDLDFNKLKQAVGDTKGRVTYRDFPSLNHLFIRVEGESTGAEYGVPGKVSPEVTAAIASDEQTTSGRSAGCRGAVRIFRVGLRRVGLEPIASIGIALSFEYRW